MSANEEELDRKEMAARIREGSVDPDELPSADDISGGETRGLDRQEQAARVREGSADVGDLPSEPAPEPTPDPAPEPAPKPTPDTTPDSTGDGSGGDASDTDTTTTDSQGGGSGGTDQTSGDVPVVESEQEAREVVESRLEQQLNQDLQAGEDFTVQQTDERFQAQLTDEFRREVAEARFEEQLEEQTGRDVEPGRGFRVVRTADDRFRADLEPTGRRRSGAAARRSDADLLTAPSMVEQGFEFERLSRREIGAARRREDPDALTPESQVEQGFEFERVSGREIAAARRREDPDALTPESMVEQGVEFEQQSGAEPQRGIDRVATALNISTSRAQELAERGELQDRIDKAGLREPPTGVDISDRASDAVVGFQDSLAESERAPRDAALTAPQRRLRNLLGGGGGPAGEDFTGAQGEIESQLESQTDVDLGPTDIAFQTEVRDGERVLTGGLTREGARTVAVETAPFQDSPVEGISEAAARVEVETDLIASDVRETIRRETGVDALFKGKAPDIDLEDIGSGLVGAGAVGVATPEPATSAAGIAGAAVGAGIVGAGVVLQGEPPEAKAQTELPVQKPTQEQTEIEAPEEAVSPDAEINVPERRDRFSRSEFTTPTRGFERPSEIQVDESTSIRSRRGEVDVPTDPDDVLIRTQQATGRVRERDREETDRTVITGEDVDDVDPVIEESERLRQIREELERRQERAREEGQEFDEEPAESRRQEAMEPEVEDTTTELERDSDTLAETVKQPSVERAQQAVATRQDAGARLTAAQAPFTRSFAGIRPGLDADSIVSGDILTEAQQTNLALGDVGTRPSTIAAQDLSIQNTPVTDTVSKTATPRGTLTSTAPQTSTVATPEFSTEFPFEPSTPAFVATPPTTAPTFDAGIRARLGNIDPDVERKDRRRGDLFGRRTDVRPGDPDEVIRDLDSNSGDVDDILEVL